MARTLPLLKICFVLLHVSEHGVVNSFRIFLSFKWTVEHFVSYYCNILLHRLTDW